MSLIESSRIFYVNGAYRETGTSANFTYSFNIPDNEKYDRCVVLQASIPLSYYLIQNGYNTFTLNEGVQSVTITIPQGNYSISSFMSVLASLLNTASPNGFIYAMSTPNQYTSASTGRYTFTVSNNSGIQPAFIFTSYMTEVFGFNLNSTNNFISNTLVTNVLNFIPENGLYLHSDMVIGDSDILQEIYSNNTVPFSIITYSCANIESYSKPLATTDTNSFRFTLTNELDQIMELNNQNMLLTVMLYKKNNVDSIFKRFIEYSLSKN
jgi:hypothetical protein